ncbi:hypothetical protein MP11Mi_14920 [Gordonia sp. MP11Mi]|uniref:Uncharacterized protein n=1 Tax=Gordonia sp. MP11Mi TaxID=3022769 RepID=A0AA97CWM6_9ACTN
MNNICPEIMTDAATGGGIRLALVRAVEDASNLPWDVARLTWRVADMEEDEHADGECACGRPAFATSTPLPTTEPVRCCIPSGVTASRTSPSIR